MLGIAADTRKAYFDAVAAEETVRYMRQVMQAAEASAELARRMAQVGNFNKLQRAREQSFYADAALNLARAEQAQRASRERLIRLLGLWGAQTQFTLPERLPDLPAEPADQPDIERQAMAQRLDVQGAKLAAEQTAKNLGLTQATRFVNVLEFGLSRKTSNEAPTEKGWEIAWSCRCSTGATRASRAAEAVYMQASTAPPRPRSTRAPRCARPTAPTAPPTTSRAITATRSCRCASDRRGEPAALQRHADRRVRAAGRRARADRQREQRTSRRCAISGSPRPTWRWR